MTLNSISNVKSVENRAPKVNLKSKSLSDWTRNLFNGAALAERSASPLKSAVVPSRLAWIVFGNNADCIGQPSD
ncbi:MAG: hypothetical protein AAGF54_09130 [Pseudomonadota bacterium]